MRVGCIAPEVHEQWMMIEQSLRRGTSMIPIVCESPMQIYVKVRQYFGLRFHQTTDISQLSGLLDISKYCLDLSVMHLRGISLA
jgi:hypothetical protein